MNNENADVTTDKPKRIHDQVPSELFSNFMKSGWTPSDLSNIEPLEVVTYAFSRRQVLQNSPRRAVEQSVSCSDIQDPPM